MTPQAFAGSPPATSRVAPTTRFGRVRRPARPAAPPRTCLTPINPLEARGGGAWLPAPKTNGPPPDRGRAVVLACVGWVGAGQCPRRPNAIGGNPGGNPSTPGGSGPHFSSFFA